MLRIHRVLATSLAIVLAAGVAAPVTANAWPMGKLNVHPGEEVAQGVTVTVQFHNKGTSDQTIKVNDATYSIPASKTITIKAAAGAQVIADTAGRGYSKGDLLYVVRGDLKDATVSFN